jgi:Ca2+/Na+ antiporter
MIVPNILPLLIFTAFVLLACPLLTTIFIYYRFGLTTKPIKQKAFISSLCFLLTLLIMFILQRQFPFSIGIWFVSYFIVISILTITEYRKQKKNTTANSSLPKARQTSVK